MLTRRATVITSAPRIADGVEEATTVPSLVQAVGSSGLPRVELSIALLIVKFMLELLPRNEETWS